MANCIIYGFLYLFAFQTVFIVDTCTTLVRGNDNTTSNALRSENLLHLFLSLSAFYNIQNDIGLLENATLLKIPNSINVSDDCYRDLNATVKALGNEEIWAKQLVDSFGKPGSDILNGQLKWLGSYDECVETSGSYPSTSFAPARRIDISGKYCKVSVTVAKTNTEPTTAEIILGICVPERCSSPDIQQLLKTGIRKHAMVQSVNVACETKKPLDEGAIAVICILSALALLITVATVYEVLRFHILPPSLLQSAENGNNVQEKIGVISEDSLASAIEIETVFDNGGYIPDAEQDGHSSDTGSSPFRNGETGSSATSDTGNSEKIPQGIPEKILLSFSVVINVKKIFATSEHTDRFAVLHGIKFLSMSWIILGHSFLFVYHYTENVYSYSQSEGSALSFMPIIFTSIAVDTFFAVTGFLVGHQNLVEMKSVKGARHFNWLLFLVHRFWRLTPTYMFVLMIFTTLMKHWSKGPFSVDGEEMFNNCQESWWTNLLYINNFVKLDQMCMGWTWYLANDMQFYFLSPLIFVSLFYHHLLGIGVCVALLSIHIVSTAVIFTEYDFHAQEVFRAVPWLDNGEYAKHVYMACYTRVGPYVVGLFTGYLLYKQNFRCQLPKILQLILWLVSITVCTLVVYGLHRQNNHSLISDGASVTYEALNRIGWSIAVCWFMFACVTGNGGWINSLLSWRPLIPLGRLTFCVYLIHPLVMLTLYRNRRVPAHLTNFEMISIFLSNHVLSYGVAFIVSISIESPMLAIEKILMRRTTNK